MKKIQAYGLAFLFVSVTAQADSMIRVKCDSKDAGAELFIDGKPVGTCSADIFVPKVGAVVLSAKKMVSADYEKVFSQQLVLEDGVAQRVQVTLSEPQMTASATQQKLKTETTKTLQEAEAGSTEAMKAVAAFYDSGLGVEKNPAKAQFWREQAESTLAAEDLRAADTGNIEAMSRTAERFQEGRGMAQDLTKARDYRERAEAAKREAREKAEAAAREKAEAAAREKLAQEWARQYSKRMEEADYFQYIKVGFDGMGNLSLFELSYTPIVLPIGTMLDLVSAPARTTEQNAIKNEAQYRASTWAKPDSMIARAARQQATVPAPVELLANVR